MCVFKNEVAKHAMTWKDFQETADKKADQRIMR